MTATLPSSEGRPSKLPGVDHRARLDECLGERLAVPLRRRDHDLDGQPELLRELEVSLVVRGHGHHRARAVGREGVIGDPDRDAVAGEVIDAPGAGEDARLLAIDRLPLDLGGERRGAYVGLDVLAPVLRGDLPHERVLRGEHHERHAVQRVGAGGEDADLVRAVRRGRLEGKRGLGALGAADPVALHQLDVIRPFEVLVGQQLLGVVGDAEEPLLHRALLDLAVAALAGAVDDLLVGEHGVAGGAPVDGGVGAVGEALAIELEEPPLRPAVVVRRAGVDLARPVEHRAHALELLAHVDDVAVGPVLGVRAAGDGGVLGGQAEGVEADREEHVVAAHAAEAGEGVRGRHREPVADVEVARGIGQHRERVPVLAPLDVVLGAVEAAVLPALSPALLDRARLVALGLRLLLGGARHPFIVRARGTPSTARTRATPQTSPSNSSRSTTWPVAGPKARTSLRSAVTSGHPARSASAT